MYQEMHVDDIHDLEEQIAVLKNEITILQTRNAKRNHTMGNLIGNRSPSDTRRIIKKLIDVVGVEGIDGMTTCSAMMAIGMSEYGDIQKRDFVYIGDRDETDIQRIHDYFVKSGFKSEETPQDYFKHDWRGEYDYFGIDSGGDTLFDEKSDFGGRKLDCKKLLLYIDNVVDN